MIVLNEIDWACEAIESRTLGNKPYETLCRVAKYYVSNGYSKKKVRDALENFLLLCEPLASIPKWSATLDYAVRHAMKRPAVEIDGIPITSSEIQIIDSLDGKQIKRLAFTLLCLAKYYDTVNPNMNHWVSCEDTEIMKMANINTSIKRQSLMYNQLWNQKLIQFSKKVDNTNVRVLFIDDDQSDVVMNITDFRNLGYQYLMYHNEPFFVCENCGVTAKIKNPGVGRRPKYCPDCAAKMYIQQTINSVMRHRHA